jgi:hypothetical protein
VPLHDEMREPFDEGITTRAAPLERVIIRGTTPRPGGLRTPGGARTPPARPKTPKR